MNAEACRALTWKAGHALKNGPGEYWTEGVGAGFAVRRSKLMDATSIVGVSAYDTAQPFAELLNTAIALSIFDGGNLTMRQRHMQDSMLSPDYDP
ncbi:hypothetical protein P171DRAFT_435344 [Karstenula rhodostoma CBS 690.94]|uniref:Uncharacterized protein n=1 Tax=Karstenula rhodostoma CBS 690.94 TaxID=1392251 RepID=A0A9P4PAN1_9PLEO|nr:hypothetical protein P171DRAFT_435344 [Karstenula rhodostoma CBS 690.94]